MLQQLPGKGCQKDVAPLHLQEQQELQLAKKQLEADCRTARHELAEAQATAAAAKATADAAHDNLRSIMLQLQLAAHSLADIHKEQDQQQEQQGSQAGDWMQVPQWQLSRLQQLYLQIVHELAVLPKLEEQPAVELGPCVPVMLRLPRLMARVVQTEQQQHQEQQVGCGLQCHLPAESRQ